MASNFFPKIDRNLPASPTARPYPPPPTEILSTFRKIESLLIFHFEIRACSQSERWYFLPSLALHAIRWGEEHVTAGMLEGQDS